MIDSIVLIIFYSSSIDFYYLGPYLLNLVNSIKYVCQSKEIKTKIINKNFLDINTMICDLIGFFNGFTRILSQNYNCYLGSEAIYNERCFLHLRKNNNDSILVICREHSGAYEYHQLKSLSQIKPKNRNIIENNDTQEKFEIKNRNILNYMKFQKAKKRKKYIGINNFKYEINKEYYDELSNNNDKKIEIIDKMNFTMITNNLDLPSESQIFEEKEKNDEYEQVLEVFDFINNVTKSNNKEKIELEKSYKKEERNNLIDNNNLINDNNNNNEIHYDINIEQNDEKPDFQIRTKNTFNSNNYFQYNTEKNDEYIHRNKTQNFNKMITIKNMELIKNIDFDEINNEDDDNYNEDNNNDNNNKYISEFDNRLRKSLMNNFNQINNNYIDQEGPQSYEQLNNFNYLQDISKNENNIDSIYLINDTTNMSINNLNNDKTININNNLINNYESNSIYYPTQINNFNNNETNLYNANDNIYYPTQSNNINQNINSSINNSIINTNTQSFSNYQASFNYNEQFQNNMSNCNNINQNQFNQYDLSFLGGYAKTNNLQEDFLIINTSNPEIISELKEKIYYHHSLYNGYKLLKISFKGYIGINIKPPKIINNKLFYINLLSEKWKDRNYFSEKEINKRMEQITEMIYKIHLHNQSNAIKLITYSINQNIAFKIKLIDSQINLNNNELNYKFKYYQESHKFVQKIEIIVEYKINYMGYNMIRSDGNIINNNYMKINVIYYKNINEGKILFPNFNNNYNIINNIKKISIMIQLKNTIISNMNAKINYSNSTNQTQESLFCKKISLLCFQYE